LRAIRRVIPLPIGTQEIISIIAVIQSSNPSSPARIGAGVTCTKRWFDSKVARSHPAAAVDAQLRACQPLIKGLTRWGRYFAG
jgi:hypothetical protein